MLFRSDTNYAAVAQSLGFFGRRVEDPQDLTTALADAFAYDGPALVDIVTDPLALSLPPTISASQVSGFALAMTKVVFNGGAGEAVQLAKSNIRHLPGM